MLNGTETTIEAVQRAERGDSTFCLGVLVKNLGASLLNSIVHGIRNVSMCSNSTVSEVVTRLNSRLGISELNNCCEILSYSCYPIRLRQTNAKHL